jgi:nucleotide-binding universal stress UspA family protein
VQPLASAAALKALHPVLCTHVQEQEQRMFKRILLPTDGTEASERATLAGASLARELGADIIGLTVMPEFKTLTTDPELLEMTPEEYAQVSAQRAEQYLNVIADAAGQAGVRYSGISITADEPDQVIIDTARDRLCDLIMMASHGRKGIKALLLGSVTQKVLVNSAIPVLVHR